MSCHSPWNTCFCPILLLHFIFSPPKIPCLCWCSVVICLLRCYLVTICLGSSGQHFLAVAFYIHRTLQLPNGAHIVSGITCLLASIKERIFPLSQNKRSHATVIPFLLLPVCLSIHLPDSLWLKCKVGVHCVIKYPMTQLPNSSASHEDPVLKDTASLTFIMVATWKCWCLTLLFWLIKLSPVSFSLIVIGRMHMHLCPENC